MHSNMLSDHPQRTLDPPLPPPPKRARLDPRFRTPNHTRDERHSQSPSPDSHSGSQSPPPYASSARSPATAAAVQTLDVDHGHQQSRQMPQPQQQRPRARMMPSEDDRRRRRRVLATSSSPPSSSDDSDDALLAAAGSMASAAHSPRSPLATASTSGIDSGITAPPERRASVTPASRSARATVDTQRHQSYHDDRYGSDNAESNFSSSSSSESDHSEDDDDDDDDDNVNGAARSSRRRATGAASSGRRGTNSATRSSRRTRTTAATALRLRSRGAAHTAPAPRSTGKRAETSDTTGASIVPSKPKDLYLHLGRLIDTLRRRDSYGFFAEPVDTKEVPEYLTVISEPMDFRTMREKVRMRVYKSVSALERDFRLVIANCRQFNPPDSIFVREATKLEAWANGWFDREAETEWTVASSSDPPRSSHSSFHGGGHEAEDLMSQGSAGPRGSSIGRATRLAAAAASAAIARSSSPGLVDSHPHHRPAAAGGASHDSIDHGSSLGIASFTRQQQQQYQQMHGSNSSLHPPPQLSRHETGSTSLSSISVHRRSTDSPAASVLGSNRRNTNGSGQQQQQQQSIKSEPPDPFIAAAAVPEYLPSSHRSDSAAVNAPRPAPTVPPTPHAYAADGSLVLSSTVTWEYPRTIRGDCPRAGAPPSVRSMADPTAPAVPASLTDYGTFLYAPPADPGSATDDGDDPAAIDPAVRLNALTWGGTGGGRVGDAYAASVAQFARGISGWSAATQAAERAVRAVRARLDGLSGGVAAVVAHMAATGAVGAVEWGRPTFAADASSSASTSSVLVIDDRGTQFNVDRERAAANNPGPIEVQPPPQPPRARPLVDLNDLGTVPGVGWDSRELQAMLRHPGVAELAYTPPDAAGRAVHGHLRAIARDMTLWRPPPDPPSGEVVNHNGWHDAPSAEAVRDDVRVRLLGLAHRLPGAFLVPPREADYRMHHHQHHDDKAGVNGSTSNDVDMDIDHGQGEGASMTWAS